VPPDEMNPRAEVVVITDASAGLGRAAARKFASHGAQIGLLARGNDGLKAARREVELVTCGLAALFREK
jgi:NADP-dependent 3-hydroxy acid dehydrogenase YdfG